MDFADAELWLFIAQSLATLEFLRPLDADGNEIVLKKELTSGTITQVFISRPVAILTLACRHPVPYECRIRPQNERTAALIRESAAAYFV
jgi:hypothetical protein